MSNERLERIKERVNYHSHLDDDIEWLIQQAERVQELEDNALDFIEYSNDKIIEVIDLKKENQRYKQALERILENWKTSNGAISGETIAFNSKEIARKALEGEG